MPLKNFGKNRKQVDLSKYTEWRKHYWKYKGVENGKWVNKFDKYRPTITHKIFETNSSFYVK